MAPTSRRAFLGSLLAAAPAIHAQTMSTDVRIKELSTSTEDFLYRTPIKFGGTEVDRVTLLNVKVTLESRAGKTAQGFGSMPMGNVWSFPSKTLRYDETLGAMRTPSAQPLEMVWASLQHHAFAFASPASEAAASAAGSAPLNRSGSSFISIHSSSLLS